MEEKKEKIDPTKTDENKRNSILLHQCEILQKLAIAWQNLQICINNANTGWGGIEFSYTDWCRLASIPASALNVQKCQTLIQTGLVLPDGSLSYYAKEALDKIAEDFNEHPYAIIKRQLFNRRKR